jgi:hypothetical protein
VVAVGLVLIVLCVLLAAGVVLTNSESVQAEAFGVSLDNVSIGGLFLIGVVVGAVAMTGLGLMLVGAARKRAKQVAVKREVRDVRGERADLAEENARLQAELERSGPAPTPGGAAGASSESATADTDHDAPGRHRG